MSERRSVARDEARSARHERESLPWATAVAVVVPGIFLFVVFYGGRFELAFWGSMATPFVGIATLFIPRLRMAGLGLIFGSLLAWLALLLSFMITG